MKEDARTKDDPRELVMRFLSDFDEGLRACDSVVEKYWLIEGESQRLLSDIQRLDSAASIEMVWYGDNIESLRLEGVRIHWGEEYRISRGLDNEMLVDLASILFT
jgi:hypothetical protein